MDSVFEIFTFEPESVIAVTAKKVEKDKSEVSSFCKRCGRKITDRLAIERGYGEDCYRKLFGGGNYVSEIDSID